jgi:hypothetical protein
MFTIRRLEPVSVVKLVLLVNTSIVNIPISVKLAVLSVSTVTLKPSNVQTLRHVQWDISITQQIAAA